MLGAPEDAATRRQIQRALGQAAQALGLPRSEDVVGIVEELAKELAYIEALRERLLMRVGKLCDKLQRMLQDWRGDSTRMRPIRRCNGSHASGRRRFASDSDELDAQTGEVISALRNVASQRAFIRCQRDWLYRSLLAWQPMLDAWANASERIDDQTWHCSRAPTSSSHRGSCR